MKRVAIILSLLAMVWGACGRQNGKTAEDTIREFYWHYITQSAKVSDYNPADVDRVMKTFLTEDLIRRLETAGLDYDPFLDAQDCEISWLYTFKIHPDTMRENTYDVSFQYDALQRSCIKLSLVCIDGKYRIDDVGGLSEASADESQFTSSIRPGKRLLPGVIFTDRFEYIGYNGDSDYYRILVNKNGETFWLVDGCSEEATSVLNRGDSVEVRWKIDSIWIAGDDDRLEMDEWAVNIDKTEEGKLSLFRKRLSKPVELRCNEEDETMDLSESYLYDLRDSVEYYMANFMQEEVREVLDDDPSATFICTINKYDGDPYYYINIYGEYENKRRLPWIFPKSLLLMNDGTLQVLDHEVWDNPCYEDDSE